MILEKTVDLVKQIYKTHKILPPKVTKVVIGLGYTGVEVTVHAHEPFLGLASTLSSIINKNDCSKIDFAGKLTNIHLNELLTWSLEGPGIKKIIGIATLNGVSQHIFKILNPYKKIEGDLLDVLEIDENTTVTFIGLIKPLIRKISKITQLITFIEDTLSITPEFKPFKYRRNINQLEEEGISTDILICTGTTLINNTIESILRLFKTKARKKIVIGPSASMIPDILFDNGIDIVGGMEIFDSEATVNILQEGGGIKLFKKYGKKYNLIKA
ncbi:hypothetical protein LCGC14_2271240 [marine sediment metagenome]|uniref:Heavy-metal chelation domain-containing protein n=1 Tax=marine sediment metagenome TaxID=412755 RepID=A0A0F9DJ69_9ZZZZ